ncbi:MAG: hypothetical protein HGA79_05615 [Anaerolineales bacterium]|nr:hypothetical protein [Anaerolineales bacterium]
MQNVLSLLKPDSTYMSAEASLPAYLQKVARAMYRNHKVPYVPKYRRDCCPS